MNANARATGQIIGIEPTNSTENEMPVFKINFIFTAEDGSEVFVHQSALEQGVTLRENDAVTFDVEQGDRGPKAVNVKKVVE